MKKILTILGTLSFVVITAANVIACSDSSTTPKDLTSIISVTELDEIGFLETSPSIDELLSGIKAKNSEAQVQALTNKDIKFKDGTLPTATTATIVGINNCTGEVTLTYTKGAIDLNSIITKTAIGIFAYDGALQTNALLPAIKALNNLAKNLLPTDFNIIASQSDEAEIKGTGNYTGTIKLTFTKSQDLNALVTKKNLGAIVMHTPYPTEYDILTALIENNPLAVSNLTIIDARDMEFSNITATTTNVRGINGYIGTFTLTYTKQTSPVDISKVITSNFLGPITMVGTVPTVDELLVAIQALIPATINLENNDANHDIVIKSATSISATIAGSGFYNSEMTLQYSKA